MSEEIPEQPEKERAERSRSDRRAGVDRRSSVTPWQGVERRTNNRRQAIDRRGLPHGLFYKTGNPLGDLYNWLRQNCIGKWSVGIEEGAETQEKKTVKVLFELERDKDTFMEGMIRGKSGS